MKLIIKMMLFVLLLFVVTAIVLEAPGDRQGVDVMLAVEDETEVITLNIAQIEHNLKELEWSLREVVDGDISERIARPIPKAAILNDPSLIKQKVIQYSD